MLAGNEIAQNLEIHGELGAAHGLARPGEVPAGIANREANGLGANVKPCKLAAIGQSGGEIGDAGRDQGFHAASLRSASVRTAPQNKA